MTTRDGTSTILLYPSGVFFDPIHPDPAKIHVADDAHHLAAIPRFGGGTREPYSVAQHAVLVSRIIEWHGAGRTETPTRRFALYGLLHECAEARSGFGDVLAPVKRLPDVAKVVKPIEKGIEAAAAQAWGFPEDFASFPIVKWADRFVLDWEDRDLRWEAASPHLGDGDVGKEEFWKLAHDLGLTRAAIAAALRGRTQVPLPEEKIVAWPFEVARTRFLERYRELGGVLPAPPWEGVP